MKFRALALAVMISTPAAAADLAAEPVYEAAPMASGAYDWSGFYVGGQLGAVVAGDLGGLELDLDGDGGFGDLLLNVSTSENQDDEAGFVGGVHVGYDYQIGSAVIGAVADLSYLNAEYTTVLSDGVFALGIRQTIDYVGTGRVRAGFAADRVLIYGTGGFAFAGIENDLLASALPSVRAETTGDDTLFGYTVGGGLDFGVSDRFTIGAHYLYTSLQDSAATARFQDGIDTFAIRTGDEIDFHRIEAKVAYRFN